MLLPLLDPPPASLFVAPALSVPNCASWSGLPLWLDFYCGCSPSPGTNLSMHGFGPRLGAPWRINVGCATRPFHGPLGIQQAVMCIACLQQPVPMKHAGVYDNICGCSPSPGTNLSVHGFGPRLGAPWRINVSCRRCMYRLPSAAGSDEIRRRLRQHMSMPAVCI